MELQKAIAAYREKFDEGPPIWDLPDDEAIEQITQAIKDGKKIDEGAETDAPDDAIL